MNCKNLRIRKRQNKKLEKTKIYYYCKVKRKEILKDDCYNCINKEYKKIKSLNNCTKVNLKTKKSKIKGSKHKLTKATEIPMKVKKIVWERDKHCCIYCHKYVDVYYANSHYIKRSQLGLGIEQNIVTACPICHDKYDFKDFDKSMKDYTKNYLSNLYEDWNEDMLVYKKS